MKKYRITYMDSEMVILQDKEVEVDNITAAFQQVSFDQWPEGTDAISIDPEGQY